MSKNRQEVSQPDAYKKRILELLGDRDPLEVLKETVEILSHFTDGYPAGVMRARPFPGKWTPNEILGHLVDGEWVYGYRLRTILCDDRPTIVSMDQEKWVQKLGHNERDPKDLVKQFKVLRTLNIYTLKHLSDEDKLREGMHQERGRESLGDMIRLLAGHDLNHIAQIRKYIEAIIKEQGTAEVGVQRK